MRLILLPTISEYSSEIGNFWLKSNYYQQFQQSINIIELCDRGCPRTSPRCPRCPPKKRVKTNSL